MFNLIVEVNNSTLQLEFWDTVPFSQIPNYILQKTKEKKGLEEQIEKLEGKQKDLQKKYEFSESLYLP